MGETKVIRVRKSTIVCIILIILLIAGCGALYYFGFVQKGKEIVKLKSDKKQAETKIAEYEDKINTLEEENKDLQDKVDEMKTHMDLLLNTENEEGLKLLEGDAYIEDGYLYYSSSNDEEPKKNRRSFKY